MFCSGLAKDKYGGIWWVTNCTNIWHEIKLFWVPRTYLNWLKWATLGYFVLLGDNEVNWRKQSGSRQGGELKWSSAVAPERQCLQHHHEPRKFFHWSCSIEQIGVAVPSEIKRRCSAHYKAPHRPLRKEIGLLCTAAVQITRHCSTWCASG